MKSVTTAGIENVIMKISLTMVIAQFKCFVVRYSILTFKLCSATNEVSWGDKKEAEWRLLCKQCK